jgi:hypothetical protein
MKTTPFTLSEAARRAAESKGAHCRREARFDSALRAPLSVNGGGTGTC